MTDYYIPPVVSADAGLTIPTYDDFSSGRTPANALSGTNFGGGGGGGPFNSATGINTFFSGVQNIASSIGDFMQAGEYNAAAHQADYEANLQRENVALGTHAVQERTNAIAGRGQAVQAANGFTNTGSIVNLTRETVQQGAQAKANVEFQGEQQEQQYEFQAKQARKMAEASTFGGIFGAILGGVGILKAII